MAIIRSVIRGVGAYLPKRVMTNEDLSKIVDTDDAWITERTGIKSRHIAADGELTSDLGIAAAKQALVRAGIDPVDIDLVICATATPDKTFPSTAVRIQHALGVTKGAAFDVQAVCSGFVYGLATADNFLKAGQSRRAIVIGAETFSRILDWNDRTTCVLFGDGAGAVVLEAQTQFGSREDRGILASRLRSDGRYEDMLYVDGGPSSTMTTGHLRMNGREVFRHAVQKISGVIEEDTGDDRLCRLGNRFVCTAPGQRSDFGWYRKKSWVLVAKKSLRHWHATAIHLQHRFRLHSMMHWNSTSFLKVISCSWRRWAADLLGARHWCVGSLLIHPVNALGLILPAKNCSTH